MKVFYMDKKRIFITGGIALAIIAVILITSVLSRHQDTTAFAATGVKPIYRVDTKEKKVAISFDAAWGADKTAGIMDIMDEHGVKGTFFLVGFWVDKYPDVVKSIAERGFEIGNHSANHPRMTQLSKEQMVKELTQVNEKIKELTGSTPTVFRPPFGDYNDLVVNTVREQNMHCIQWDVDSLDWKDLSADEITKRVTSKIKPGSIVLFHNAAKHTPEALPGILEKLKSDGYNIIPISQLIYADNYTIDTEGRQHLNSNTASDSEKSR